MNQSENVSLNELETATVKVRTPKRVLHFSDGILEEYSDDEHDSTPPNEQSHTEVIDTSTLSWTSWILYKAWSMGTLALSACDYAGEGLANFFGITSPKYWAEIEEYKRAKAEENERGRQAEGWSEPAGTAVSNTGGIQINQPGVI